MEQQENMEEEQQEQQQQQEDMELIPITSQKHDPGWKHCEMYRVGEKVQLKCVYCGKMFKGGGIHRIKEHLAGQKGSNAAACLRVSSDVRESMQQVLNCAEVRKRKKRKVSEDIVEGLVPVRVEMEGFGDDRDDVLVNNAANVEVIAVSSVIEPSSTVLEGVNVSSKACGGERKKRGRGKRLVVANCQANNDSVGLVVKKVVNDRAQMAIARFLYDIGAPLDAVNSAYFQPMVDAIASEGSDFLLPSYRDLRGRVLKSVVEEVRNDVNKIQSTWTRTGCSLLVDESNTKTGRMFLNFFVYCPEGAMFLKSIDTCDIYNLSDSLYKLLKQVVEEIGSRHILQVVTSTEQRYVLAGKKLMDTFPTLYWAPCMTGCLDSILQDFSKLKWISAAIEQAKSITRFIYNHSAILTIMRKYTHGNDIVELGTTRLDTNFLVLKKMVDLKENLQDMVISQDWVDCPSSKEPEGLETLNLVTDQLFWSSCELISHLTNPLLRLLRIVCSKKQPAMGYVYAGMYRVKEAIKKELIKREEYTVYWNIIDHWWQQQLNLQLLATGFFLNPKFYYSTEGDLQNEILSTMLDCIEKLVPDIKVQDKIIKEVNLYKNATGDLGSKMAVRAREMMSPVEWWSTYGGSCPNLAHLANHILSQTCSTIGFRQNHISLEQLHDTTNVLERQRLCDLVFVQHNLHLRQIVSENESQHMDPVLFDCNGFLEDWMKGKDLSPEYFAKSEWISLDTHVVTSHTRRFLDEVEDLGSGFDDYEIFAGLKAGDKNVEDGGDRVEQERKDYEIFAGLEAGDKNVKDGGEQTEQDRKEYEIFAGLEPGDKNVEDGERVEEGRKDYEIFAGLETGDKNVEDGGERVTQDRKDFEIFAGLEPGDKNAEDGGEQVGQDTTDYEIFAGFKSDDKNVEDGIERVERDRTSYEFFAGLKSGDER